MARAVRAISRSLPARLRHLDQRALAELRRHHGRLPRLARAAAAKDRGADCAWQCAGAVWRRALSAGREGRLNPQTRSQKLASGDTVEAKFRGDLKHSDVLWDGGSHAVKAGFIAGNGRTQEGLEGFLGH